MRSIRRLTLAVSTLATLALTVPGVRPATSSAHAAARPSVARLGRDPGTGRVIFVGTHPGRSVPSALAGASALPASQNALSFVRAYGQELGLRDVDSELRSLRVVRRSDGRSVVRYRQVHNDIPILGADVVVNTDRSGALLALSAKISPAPELDTEPTIAAAEALDTAVEATAKYRGANADTLRATTPELWIYDSRLLLPEGLPPVLTWRVEVSDGAGVREVVLVNAHSGAIALNYNQVDTSWSIPPAVARLATGATASASAGNDVTSDATNGAASALGGDTPPALLGTPLLLVGTMNHHCLYADSHCSGTGYGTLPGTTVCTQASPTACDADRDARLAYRYGLDTYDFYAAAHARDSIDNAGLGIVASVHYGTDYANAYWNGSQVVFGDGFPAADDVVAHELTHGVTEHESGLLYFGQPGAINESFSDIWGEIVDLTNGHGLDTAAVKWLMGEEVPGLGVVRSMKHPPAYGDPDSMLSANYYTGTSDGFGVHTNSGVGNKAAYLMVEGGVFGGKTVTPLGIEKTADIFYEAQTNLIGSGTNYLDLYYALQQACSNLVGTGGITLNDCASVREALDAVQMYKTKSSAVYPTIDYCPVGQSLDPVFLFDEDFEGGAANWDFVTLQGTNGWALDTTRRDTSSGSSSLIWEANSSGISDSYAAMNGDVLLPEGWKPYLRFDHDMWGLESGAAVYDGGLVECSTNGGVTWNDLSAQFAGGKSYRGLVSGGFGNPLKGRKAFGGFTVSYTETVYSLSTLAGKTFRLRFRVGTDNSVGSEPWYVDDVRIYACVPTPTRPILRLPTNGALVASYVPTLDWTDSTGDAASYHLQIATDSLFGALEYDEPGLGSSGFAVPIDLASGTKYYWRVRALNPAGSTLGWTNTFAFYTAMTPPVLIAPADAEAVRARRPTFDWSDTSMATGYTVQVSTTPAFASVVLTGTVTTATSTLTPTVDLPVNALLYWRVRTNSPKGSSPWSATRSFTTGNPPGVPVLLAPATNLLVSDYTPRFDWGPPVVPAGTTFDRYELEVDDNTDFSSPAIDVDVPGLETHEYTPVADLPANTTLYWRARAWNAAGEFGGWALVRSLRTALTPPAPSLPATGAYTANRRPTFDWSDVPGATGYTLQVSHAASFAPLVLTGNVTTGTSTFTPTTDLAGTGTFYWRVRASGANGPSLWSAADTFTCPSPPSVPALISPGHMYGIYTLTPRLDWAASTVLAGTTFDYYELELSQRYGSWVQTVRVYGVGAHQYTPPTPLLVETFYDWRVRAANTAGEISDWSPTRYFYTMP